MFGSDKSVDVGDIRFRIKACLKNSLYWDDINCVTSEVISVQMSDPCEQTSLESFYLTRPLRSKKGKSEQFVIPGPFDAVDLATAESGVGKCGAVLCTAYLADRATQPDFLAVNNRIFDAALSAYNTQLVLKPIADRDETGQFNIFLDCAFTEYPDLGVFTQQINVEILEPSRCAPGEGGTNDSSCSDSSEEVQSDDDLGNGVSADDSSNDGYSGNAMGSSDSSGDGPSLRDNVTSDTTGDGESDNLGRRRLRELEEKSFAMTHAAGEEEHEKPRIRLNHRGEPARFHRAAHSADEAAQVVKRHQRNQNKKVREPAAERRNMQGAPKPHMVQALAPAQHCPVGQYMAKDSSQCALCFPRTLFVDRKRAIDLAENAAVHASCPSAYVAHAMSTQCLLTNMMDREARPVTLQNCKIPAGTLDARTMYKLTVSFKQNGLLSHETQDLNLMPLEDDFPKPSCALEGFNHSIKLDEGTEHRINLKVFDTLDNQQYRWTCTPALNQVLADEAVCPFDVRPLTLNPQLVISDKDFKPPGSKFELTLNMVRENTNIVESCSVIVQKQFKAGN